MAFQSCTVLYGMPPGVIHGVVQELHQCLAPLIEEDGLLNLEVLDVAKKDPVALASAPASSTPNPEEEDWAIQVLEESYTSEPEETVNLERGLDLVWGRYPTIPLGFGHLQVNQAHAGLARGIPLGAQLDFCSLWSLQVTISHDPAAGEVHYEY